MRGLELEPARLIRSLAYTVGERGPAGGVKVVRRTLEGEAHWVKLTDISDAAPPCDCGDAAFVGPACVHVCAVLLWSGDEDALSALGAAVYKATAARRLMLVPLGR